MFQDDEIFELTGECMERRARRLQAERDAELEAHWAELEMQEACQHEWEEQPGEPPCDVCTRCGATRW